jgi:hypothetical protein
MCTTGLLSMPRLHKLLDIIHPLKREFYTEARKVPITIDTAILRHPAYLSASILPKKYSKLLDPAIAIMEVNAESYNNPYKGFFDFELAKLLRFKSYAEADPNKSEKINLNITRTDFISYINEYDKRRNKSFKKVFPELEEFYESCL